MNRSNEAGSIADRYSDPAEAIAAARGRDRLRKSKRKPKASNKMKSKAVQVTLEEENDDEVFSAPVPPSPLVQFASFAAANPSRVAKLHSRFSAPRLHPRRLPPTVPPKRADLSTARATLAIHPFSPLALPEVVQGEKAEEGAEEEEVLAQAVEEEAVAAAMETAMGAVGGENAGRNGESAGKVDSASLANLSSDAEGSNKNLSAGEAATLEELEFFNEFTDNFEGVPSLKEQSR